MDLEDFFNRDHHRHKPGHRKHDDHHGHDADRQQKHYVHPDDLGHLESRDRQRDHHDRPYSHKGHQEMFDFEHIPQLLLANKKLLIIAGGVLLVVIVLGAIFLLPLLGQALDYVDKGGVKGVIDRVWQGTGGGK